MPAIENVNRRGATYWWRRRVRFVGRLERPITIVTTVSLLTKEQSVARRRAVAMTSRSEVVRMSFAQRCPSSRGDLSTGNKTDPLPRQRVRSVAGEDAARR